MCSLLNFSMCSKNVFGVSAESMQCSIDNHGNMVPTILLLLQKQLYDQHGLKVCLISGFWLQLSSTSATCGHGKTFKIVPSAI